MDHLRNDNSQTREKKLLIIKTKIMNIEVTKETFFTVFNELDYVKTINLELADKQRYFNAELEQQGLKIHNFISNVTQYYLTDINA